MESKLNVGVTTGIHNSVTFGIYAAKGTVTVECPIHTQ